MRSTSRALLLAMTLSATGSVISQAGEPVPRTPPLPASFAKRVSPGTTVGRCARKGGSAPVFSPFSQTAEPPVDPQALAVRNPIAITFNFAIWNPKTGEWERFEAGQGRTDITCSLCTEKARIAFHNGREQVTYAVKMGTAIRIQWSPESKLWALFEGTTALNPDATIATSR